MKSVFTVKLDLPDPEGMLKKRNLETGGRVQEVIDKAVIEYSKPYLPFDRGILSDSAYTATVIGSGEVVYSTPGARYLYYGKVYGPNIPVFDDNSGEPTRFFSPPGQKKHPTGADLTYNTDYHPLAGAFWFERMKADHIDDIVGRAKDEAGIK